MKLHRPQHLLFRPPCWFKVCQPLCQNDLCADVHCCLRGCRIFYHGPALNGICSISSRADLLYIEDLQSVAQHVYSSDSTLLRLVFVTEWGCKILFKHLKSRRFFWHDKNTQGTVDFPVRFERDFTALERFERVSLQTLIFVFNSMDGSPSKVKTCDRIGMC